MESSSLNPSSPESSSPESIDELRAQVASLTRRVAALEQSAGLFARPAVSATPQPSAESRFGLTAVNRTGAITLALGILFFFKYAADQQWIGPLGRLLLGLFAGLGFLGFGERLRAKGQANLALGITGCGFAILYITAYASDAFYKILLPGASLFLMVCAAALGVVVAVRAKSQASAAIALVTLFAAPLFESKILIANATLAYLALALAASLFVTVQQQWVALPIVTLSTAALSGLLVDSGAIPLAAYLAVAAVLFWSAQARVQNATVLSGALFACGHAALLMSALRLISYWASPVSVALTIASVALAIYGIGLLAFGVAQRSNLNRLTGLTLIALVVIKLYLYDIWQLSYGFRITAFVLLGALLLAASFVYSRWRARS